MWRDAGGDEDHAVEAQVLGGIAREKKVSIVNRIESAAVESQGCVTTHAFTGYLRPLAGGQSRNLPLPIVPTLRLCAREKAMVAIGVVVLVAAMVTAAAQSPVRSQAATFRVETLAEGLQNPWGLVKLPDGRFLVTERPGRLRVIEDGRLVAEPVVGTPQVWAHGQGGLLDIQLHPDYARTGWIYLAFSDPDARSRAMTKIVRGRLRGEAWADEETVFQADPAEYTESHVHFGCRMVFDGQGYLFFSIGDRGERPDPQNASQRLDNPKGKVLRIFEDGRIPPDNPFIQTPGAHPAIWTLGNRNIQGMILDGPRGILWAVEHGPRGGDELNIIRRGANYGWPIVTRGINYSGTPITDKTEAPGIEPPVIDWTPSIAVGGLAVYYGDAFPGWKGNLFATALAGQKLVRIELGDGGSRPRQENLLERTGRIRDVRVVDDGFLYVVYDEPGRIVRLVPAS